MSIGSFEQEHAVATLRRSNIGLFDLGTVGRGMLHHPFDELRTNDAVRVSWDVVGSRDPECATFIVVKHQNLTPVAREV
ncbi:hypothetical protein D3C84_1066770 [compost metagenome]